MPDDGRNRKQRGQSESKGIASQNGAEVKRDADLAAVKNQIGRETGERLKSRAYRTRREPGNLPYSFTHVSGLESGLTDETPGASKRGGKMYKPGEENQPFWSYALFDARCTTCRAKINAGDEVYIIPESGSQCCRHCGNYFEKKPRLLKQQTSLSL